MIFPVAECERTVQVGDKTRLLGVKSYVGKGEDRISKVEICPDFAISGSQPVEFIFDGSGYVDDSGTQISQVYDDKLAQVLPGMPIRSGNWADEPQATVSSVDVENHTIYIQGAQMLTAASPIGFSIQTTIDATVEPKFIDVSGQDERDWYLDWAYDGVTRDVVMAVRVTSGSLNQTATKSLKVLAKADDVLFSNDDDLQALEPGLTRFVPEGRASFINVHREAKLKILEGLSDEGIRNADGSALTPAVLKNADEVRTWSRDLTLSLIFQGMSNEASDVFQQKAKFYQDQALARAGKAFLSFTVPVKGSDEPYRAAQIQTVRLSR